MVRIVSRLRLPLSVYLAIAQSRATRNTSRALYLQSFRLFIGNERKRDSNNSASV